MMSESCEGVFLLSAGARASVVEPASCDIKASPECRFDLGVRRLYRATAQRNWGARFTQWWDRTQIH
jgi:hypothetical protein